ncbi:MAG: ABC-F family ATP-binding cassette domain-containing protein [Saprospiraceae bacterium]|nr:ABC-F family ATP-binding cassette domain-containing protein [Saprospiraceae bacterium]
MLLVSDLSLHFGDRTLFDNLSFSIQAGEKVALIGRNGTGKTTLFRVLAGEIKPDGGRREIPADWRIGYLSQDIRPVRKESVWDIAMAAFEEARTIDQSLRQIEEKLTANVLTGDALEQALVALEDGHHRLHMLGWEQAEGEAAKVLKGLGFQQSDFQRPLNTFSGGWQVRVWLAKLLLERPQFLMLDEPTNHLDIEAILWLEQFLSKSEMALLLVSHDRRFLEACSTRIMELQHGELDDYHMSYSRYLDERSLRFQQRLEAAESQQRKIQQMQATIDRFRAKASKASMAKSMEKQLAKMDVIDMPGSNDRSMNLRFAPAPRSGQVVFDGRSLKKVYGEKTVFSGVDLKIDREIGLPLSVRMVRERQRWPKW